jgi:hypothetical protein
MGDKPSVTGPQAAMIYLAESLSDVKNELRTGVGLLRELVELVKGQQQAGGDQVEIQEDDFVRFMKEQEAKAAAQQNGSGK